ncbi:hypothetical protein BH10ACI1_BH10ACI1_12080 [soil metagenome]
MKNKSVSIIAILVLLFAALGCNYINELSNSNSNKTLAEKAVDNTTGEKKTGIKECDDLLDNIARRNKSKDDNFIKQAANEIFLNALREKVTKNFDENKKDPAKQAKECKEYQEQLDKYFKEKDSNSNRSI